MNELGGIEAGRLFAEQPFPPTRVYECIAGKVYIGHAPRNFRRETFAKYNERTIGQFHDNQPSQSAVRASDLSTRSRAAEFE